MFWFIFTFLWSVFIKKLFRIRQKVSDPSGSGSTTIMTPQVIHIFANCEITKGNWCKLTNRYKSGIFVVKSNSHRLILSNMIKSKARKESNMRTCNYSTYLMLIMKSGDTQIWKTIGFLLGHGYKYDIHGLPNALMVFLVSVCNRFETALCSVGPRNIYIGQH